MERETREGAKNSRGVASTGELGMRGRKRWYKASWRGGVEIMWMWRGLSANVSNHIKERRKMRADPQHSIVHQSDCSG